MSHCYASCRNSFEFRQWAIVPGPFDQSIVAAEAFDYWVRDGTRLDLRLAEADQVVPLRSNHRTHSITNFSLRINRPIQPADKMIH